MTDTQNCRTEQSQDKLQYSSLDCVVDCVTNFKNGEEGGNNDLIQKDGTHVSSFFVRILLCNNKHASNIRKTRHVKGHNAFKAIVTLYTAHKNERGTQRIPTACKIQYLTSVKYLSNIRKHATLRDITLLKQL